MFTILSQESVSAIPGKAALYASCTIHFCAVIALTWFSVFNVSTVRFELMRVQAGSREPVREPQPVYIYGPTRNWDRIPSQHTKPVLPAQISSQTDAPNNQYQTASNDGSGFTATEIPSDFLALLHTEPGPAPPVSMRQYGTRTIPELQPPELSLPPPEPPPGEPDRKPPLVIGGHLKPAELIRQTQPTYPPLARTARVQGVVLLEGTVNASGIIENIHVVDGHPLLVDEAVKAVKKWKYRPAILNGEPTPCPVTITVRFILKDSGE
jgi:TonB family protein